MIIEKAQQRRSKVGECEISSVNYTITNEAGTMRIDETCLFWPNGDSRVVGNYDAHDTVVTALNAARDRS